MTLLLLAFLGGVLTILSPCILPVIPLAFSRAGRSVRREIVPMLFGLALAFTFAAVVAASAVQWLAYANEGGRYLSLMLLGLVGVSLLSERAAFLITRPFSRIGTSLAGGTAGDVRPSAVRNIVVGMAIGLLWAPCAGPILGLVIAAAAAEGRGRAATLFFTFAIGAAMSLGSVLIMSGKLLARFRKTTAASYTLRRVLGVATIGTVVAIFFGWDQALFAKGGLIKTANAEEVLVARLAPSHKQARTGLMSLDDFAAEEAAKMNDIDLAKADGDLPSLAGGTEWINSAELSPAKLRGKVVLVDFWTFACYNCLNALPHVKELYAKYKDRGFVVVGVHTPELAHERIPENVRREVKRLGIDYPVVIDNSNTIWSAFHNEYWPAAYYADATGKLRFYHFGEGRYEDQDRLVAKLLAERDAAAR